MFKVNLTYFKPNGTYYTSSNYETNLSHMFEIHDEVNALQKTCKLPGILGNDWIIFIDVPDHPHNFPKIILPNTR